MTNSSEKLMPRFIETIRIEAGLIYNLPYHQERMDRTFRRFFPAWKAPSLQTLLDDAPREEGVIKARIEYDGQHIFDKRYFPYTMRTIRSLRLVEAPSIAYAYKSADRSALENLARQKGDADELIIVQNGLLTDTTYSNIALWEGSAWYTPAHPLLPGTMRQFLLDHGQLKEAEITIESLGQFRTIALINAMMPLGRCTLPTGSITRRG